MVYSDYTTKLIDKDGLIYLINKLKEELGNAEGVDLSNYVTKDELQEALANAGIDVDLSSYVTKEELEQALTNVEVDLTGYATTEYVDNAIANIPTSDGGTTDLSNYYTKEEVYNKEEVDAMISSDNSNTATILSYEDWLTLNTTYDMNIDLSGKTIYIDTGKRFSDMLEDTTHELWFYNTSVDGKVSRGRKMRYENGRLIINHGETTDGGFSSREIVLFDKTKEEGDTITYAGLTVSGTYHNGWRIADAEELASVCLVNKCFTLGDDIYNPCYDYYSESVSADDDSVTIDQTIKGEELLDAFLRCVTMIIDADGNEVAFKTVPSASEYLAYVESCDSNTGSVDVDLSNYYNKEEVDALIPTVTNGTDGVDGVSPTITENAENSDTVYKLDITDANGTFTTPNLKGADGVSGSGSTSSGGTSTNTSNIYSTEEVVVGTWIDGKPIYRKVINYTEAISHNTYTTFLSDIENIESIIYLGGMVDDRNILHYPVPFYGASNTYCWVSYHLSGNYFAVQLNIGNAGVSGIRIIIEYTKTTD